MGIYDALNASRFKGRTISPVMEKISSPMWPVEIYRFHVSRGYDSEIIRMDAQGNVIQEKDLSE